MAMAVRKAQLISTRRKKATLEEVLADGGDKPCPVRPHELEDDFFVECPCCYKGTKPVSKLWPGKLRFFFRDIRQEYRKAFKQEIDDPIPESQP